MELSWVIACAVHVNSVMINIGKRWNVFAEIMEIRPVHHRLTAAPPLHALKCGQKYLVPQILLPPPHRWPTLLCEQIFFGNIMNMVALLARAL